MENELKWLLHNLIEKVPGTKNAVLLTVDGLKTSWYGMKVTDADHAAAIASSMCGTAKQFGTVFGDGTGIRQVVAEVGNVYAFITAASENTMLAVIAEPTVETRVLSHEMHHLCSQVRAHLATPSRTAPTGGPRST